MFMGRFVKTVILVICIATLAGCASTRYEWNNYDSSLYDYYKTPSEQVRFAEALQETIQEGESQGGGRRVPPGIYAEYGFLMYEMGNSPLAIQYYQKEAENWPESRVFMNKMIAVAQKRKARKAAPPQPPAAADAVTTKPAEVAK